MYTELYSYNKALITVNIQQKIKDSFNGFISVRRQLTCWTEITNKKHCVEIAQYGHKDSVSNTTEAYKVPEKKPYDLFSKISVLVATSNGRQTVKLLQQDPPVPAKYADLHNSHMPLTVCINGYKTVRVIT